MERTSERGRLDVIAVRELEAGAGRKESARVVVQLGRPIPADQDWICPFEIVGLGEKVRMHAAGVDPMQALVFALQMIGVRLRTDKLAAHLRWLGGRDLGFPDLSVPTPDNGAIDTQA